MRSAKLHLCISCWAPGLAEWSRLAQLVADVGDLCRGEAGGKEQSKPERKQSVETERRDSEHDTRLKLRTHTHEIGMQVWTVAADLWLIPWRPNSDRISFITEDKKKKVSCFKFSHSYFCHILVLNSSFFVWCSTFSDWGSTSHRTHRPSCYFKIK